MEASFALEYTMYTQPSEVLEMTRDELDYRIKLLSKQKKREEAEMRKI